MPKNAANLGDEFRNIHDERDLLAYKAALAYYVQDETMETIRTRMGISRSTVSRLISYARAAGIVRIQVCPVNLPDSRLAAALEKRFPIRAQVVNCSPQQTQSQVLNNVTKVAAQMVSYLVKDADVVGIAWGNTTSEMAQHIQHKDLDSLTLVQLNGAASPETSGLNHISNILNEIAERWNAHTVHFPVPAFFDDPALKEAMWKERAVRRVLDWQEKCSLAIFSVGSLKGEIPSRVYAAGYLSPEELIKLQKDAVVGDVCTVLLRADGSWKDIELNKRATGATPDVLRQIPRRFCLAAGQAKAYPLLGALRAGVVTDLVCDNALAKRVLALAEANK